MVNKSRKSCKFCYLLYIFKRIILASEVVVKSGFYELKEGRSCPNVVVFLSGQGSNAEVLLKLAAAGGSPEYKIVALATDRPEQSRAAELAELYNLPLVAHDIKEFYHSRGEKVSVATETGSKLRRVWTQELLDKLAPFSPDFGVFAGFIPLCNLNEFFPCLNVHPGDLTVEDEQGERILTGLHTIPVERAILRGLSSLRSSVIVVQSPEMAGKNMDSGPILGVSAPMPIDLMGYSLEDLAKVAAQRPAKRPIGGFKDTLEAVADHNQDLLKYAGDHLVLPKTVAQFATGVYSTNQLGELFHNNFDKIKTLEFTLDGSVTPIY